MAEKTVVIAKFFSNEEAEAARLFLKGSGISCSLTADTPSPVSFSLFGRMNYAPIGLHVAASQAERATQVLASRRENPLPKDWMSRAEEAVDGWIGTNCDTPAPDAFAVCPECSTPRPPRHRKKKR
jgi:hypothetical protein